MTVLHLKQFASAALVRACHERAKLKLLHQEW